MKIFTKLLFALLFVSPVLRAQDWHYSQFYYAPLLLNPAMTGNMDGTYRIGLNYRNQWASISAPYVYSTPSVWGDVSLFRGKYSGNSLAMGLMLMDDKQGDGNLSTLDVMYSLAYHQTLDGTGNFHISAGLQGGIMQRRIDASKLYFYNQFNGIGFDNNITSGEKIDPTYTRADFAAGAAFSGLLNDYSRVTLGFSAFHLTKPNESFKNESSDMYVRYTMHGSGTIGIKNTFYIFPAAYYQIQGPNSEVVAGTALGYNFAPNKRKVGTIFYIGSFYRNKDALIATTGFLLKGLQFGISYDVNISDLQVASNNQGGFEIAIKYGNVVQQKKMKKAYCPRF